MTKIILGETGKGRAINEAITVLLPGGIVAYPTETFYGLGVRFDLPESLQRLYELKKRPGEKAMPVIIGRRELLSLLVPGAWLAGMPKAARALMDRFWPGPLTLLLPAKEGLSEFLTAGTKAIAVRVPGESFALQLAKQAGFPITATSANISGRPPAVNGGEVIEYFGDAIDLLVDGGESPASVPSTIVDISGPDIRMVREGRIRREQIEQCLSESRIVAEDTTKGKG
jgi:L-threonylcarbamoyladenylate synthase